MASRVLALDVGEQRIGVAMSDELGKMAFPFATILAKSRPRVLEQVMMLVSQHQVGEVVVGLPLTLRGEVGPQAQAVQSFVQELENQLGYAVHLVDERLTSVAAEQMMRDLGIKPAKRKEMIDQIAASIILQDFLDLRKERLSTTEDRRASECVDDIAD